MEREPTDTDLTAALLDAAAVFDGLRVAFAVVVGLAAMVHGRARFTEDVGLVDGERYGAYPQIKARVGWPLA